MINKANKRQQISMEVDGVARIPLEFDRHYKLDLLPGEHEIVINSFGFEEIQKQIVIDDDEIERIAKSEWKEKMILVNLKPPKVEAEYFLYPKNNTNVFDITNKDTVILPFGKYTIIGNAPKHEESKTHFTINSNDPEFIVPNLYPKTKKKAKAYGWFPGAGLVYAEKKKIGFSVMAGTIASGAMYLFSRDKYSKEYDKLNVLQADYLENTDLDQSATLRNRRDTQQKKVNDLGLMKDLSGGLAGSLYFFNIGYTYFFHGL